MKQSLILVPEEFLSEIKNKQDQIISLLESKKDGQLPKFITEKEAKCIFNKQSTWFWQMRRDGILPFSKIGKSIFYSIDDLNKVLENRSKPI